jgi:hypothetical protein
MTQKLLHGTVTELHEWTGTRKGYFCTIGECECFGIGKPFMVDNEEVSLIVEEMPSGVFTGRFRILSKESQLKNQDKAELLIVKDLIKEGKYIDAYERLTKIIGMMEK